MAEKKLYTSESVTEGHPDKLSDQISDSVLDAIIATDPNCRVACETFVTTGLVVVGGEISTTCYVDIPKIVRTTIKEVGYTDASYGFDGETCAVVVAVDEQSRDIALGVNNALENKQKSGQGKDNDNYDEIGAGDQGMMYGFACNETDVLMPAPIVYAHRLTQRLALVRKRGSLRYLRPDGKSQVTLEYDGNKPIRAEAIVISTQHGPDVTQDIIREDIISHVIKPVMPENWIDKDTKIFVNPTGKFVIGGPHGDAGLTGRKIIVDTYGGMGRHGGGAFSGKDPTKVDRSACYAARHAAKNIVAAGLADRCEIQLAYAIGVAAPVSISVDTCGTGKISDQAIAELVRKSFDLRPLAIIERLKLRQPIYKSTASYGHFGRTDVIFPWEKTDFVDILKKAIESK